MNNPLISVIIPVYNTSKYLKRAVYSVLNNTYKNLEVICVDDGSTDNSLSILTELAETDGRVKVISKRNEGVSSARNCGVDVAQGAWISFVDSDDWIRADFFDVMLSVADAETDIIACRFQNVYTESQVDEHVMQLEPISIHDIEMSRIWCDMHLSSTCWGKLYRKKTIGDIRFPYGIQLSEDGIFNAKVFANKDSIKLRQVNQIMYYYFNRNDSLVHSKPMNRYVDASNAYLEVSSNSAVRDLCTVQALRHVFTYRYEGMLVGEKTNALRFSKPILRKCMQLLPKCKNISMIKKCMLTIAIISPGIYRVSLILRDPTYIKYEKLLRQRFSRKDNEVK